MTHLDIPHWRLHNQHLAGTRMETPEAVVAWLGAVQAQDYAGAKWAVGQRTLDCSDADLDRLLADGTILRTHILRPTWHLVMPTDIRWMLSLTAPRINAAMAYAYRQVELDDTLFARSDAVLAQALQGGQRLTRADLCSVLQQAGLLGAHEGRLNYLLIHAELAGMICSGGLRGKQHTYALLDERCPEGRTLTRDQALAELVRRYFTSHGPATVKDYVWWSGLTMTDARAGLNMVKSQLAHTGVDGQTYWFADGPPSFSDPSPTAYLLPNYDEYVVGYTDRHAIFDPTHLPKLDSRVNPLFNYVIVIDGHIVGTWKRTFKTSAVVMTFDPFTPLSEAETQAVVRAAHRYAQFLHTSTELVFDS
ncbi:MAG: AlkZ family DNA glycosylase [Anaerolineae bacterium]|nr:AlkZ family DNA glycosylase [Anaerolineae bacterium]